jgi:anti-sigma regulatory factor (Ser/Thr protein kinase)/Fe-S-cluster-containing hydrogenase component 2
MPEALKFHFDVDGEDFTSAGKASVQVKKNLRQLGLPPEIIRRVSIAMYEGEINMVIHAGGGEADVTVSEDCIEIFLHDKGPGIKDIERAMQEGYSTASDQIRSLGFGAGMGLPNMKRYTDSMEINSTVGVGTDITMKVMLSAGAQMNRYEHSVYLDEKKCSGCTACLKHCPTEAIRIREGHASIDPDRCIDCGECIRVCPHNAKKAVCEKLSAMDKFKWKIALPAPSLYGQFDNLEDVDYVLDGLIKIGFDDVFEVSAAAELVSAYTRLYLKTEGVKKPAISSACPVVIRLIGLRFPSLTDNIIHMLPPMEVAAMLARKRAKREHPELSDEEIGVCFISPCPAKVSYVKNGFAGYKSQVDTVVSINDIYFQLIAKMQPKADIKSLSNSGMIGIGWASTGGEATAIFNESYLAADGIENVIRVLDQVENGNIPPLEFIELNACSGGCVGGVMTMQNPFIAKARLQTLRRYLPVSQNFLSKEESYIPESYIFNEIPTYHPISRLSDSMAESMRMMADIQKLRDTLPGIDCGACGAPNCRAFAEDTVRNKSCGAKCPLYKEGDGK